MLAVPIFAVIIMVVLAIVLARWAPPIYAHPRNDNRPPMPIRLMRAITAELLARLGFDTVEESIDEEPTLLAIRRAPLGSVRCLVRLIPSAPGGLVDQATVVTFAEAVKSEGATVGMIITPEEIETAGLAGLDVSLELIDGPRFRTLVAEHVPYRLPILTRYRGFTPPPPPRGELVQGTDVTS